MESWRVFAAATDLDEALSTAHEVQADDGAVEEEIRTLCEKDWSVLTKQDSQALFNLLQNCSLIIPEALRRATLCKALACARAAFRLAGVVGCQHAQLDDDLVQRLAELCPHEKNGTVVARAATTIRGSLQWPRDKDVVCRILVRACRKRGVAGLMNCSRMLGTTPLTTFLLSPLKEAVKQRPSSTP